MTLHVTVAGGTNAGHRVVPKPPPSKWTCPCGTTNPGYAVTCLGKGCRDRRPRG